MKNSKFDFYTILGGVITAIAIFGIASLFRDDNSKVISSRGKEILSDDEAMKKIDEEINKMKHESPRHGEVVVELD